ncbi:MAG: hypothetical protein KDA41_10620, partial [Planctomycetales bacterium]|nr:hypothetical protein [Planctomycetales bacterium]
IAARLSHCPHIPVVVEPSMSTKLEDTEFHYPVHANPELDLQRRELVVLALSELGVRDAESRVVVAPAYAEGFNAAESQRVYSQATSAFFGGGRGFNGLGGGGFGFGGFGGFGF